MQVAQDDGSNIRLEFRAPGASSDQGMVDHYQSCCTYFLDGSDPSTSEISSCHQITPDCNPVEAGLTQSCVINRGSLKDNHVDSAHNPVALNCGVRGVNSMGREGQSSMGSLVVDLDSSTGILIKRVAICDPLLTEITHVRSRRWKVWMFLPLG